MRTAAFIDGPNFLATAKAIGMHIDFAKLLNWLRPNGQQLVRAFYYTAIDESEEFSPIRPLVDWLDYNGYTMVTKAAKEFTDSTGRRKIKGNMDIEIAVDMLEIAPHVDQIVLFSGDGDFRRLVESVQRKGVHVSVVSTLQSIQPLVADELRRQADWYIDLENLRGTIAKTDKAQVAA